VGLSERELAERAGTSASAICRGEGWEVAVTNLPVDDASGTAVQKSVTLALDTLPARMHAWACWYSFLLERGAYRLYAAGAAVFERPKALDQSGDLLSVRQQFNCILKFAQLFLHHQTLFIANEHRQRVVFVLSK